jgi:hypothetical protein
LSTHTIGPVRLLLGSLVLLLAGAAVFWFLWGRSTGGEVLVIRGGALEIEPWAGDLRIEGSDVWWDHAVTGVHLSVAKALSDEEEFVLADPVSVAGVKTVRIDIRIANSRTVEDALVLVIQDTGVKMSLKEGQLARRGDVWVHPGFVQNGQAKRYEISKIEFLDRADQMITRYQNPDLGRRFRFRLKLSASKGISQ